MDLRMGDVVTWKTQGLDYERTRRGKIVGVVPEGQGPVVPSGYRLGDGFGGGWRKHESYLVAVDIDVYWPAASSLNKVDEAKELAEALSHFVNGMGHRVEDVVKHLSGDHRTLQQGITKFCVAWLEECARKYKNRDFDLRNEASAELGQAVVERTTPAERAMPFI